MGRGHPVFSSPFSAFLECAGCARPLPAVFVCATSGVIAAVRPSDGKIVGELCLGGEVFSSPVVAAGRLVVGCRDDRVYSMDVTARCSQCKPRGPGPEGSPLVGGGS